VATSAGPSRAAPPSVGTPSQWVVVAIPVAVVTGIIGSIMDPGDTQALLFAIDAIAATIASFLLTILHVRAGRVFAAAGFAALGALSVAAQVAGYTGAAPESVFGSLGLLFFPALLLIAAEAWSFPWARGAAAAAGLVFAVWSLTYVLGEEPVDSQSVVVIIAWILFAVANVGWVMTVMAEGDGPGTRSTSTL
jgi:hypothetical protein